MKVDEIVVEGKRYIPADSIKTKEYDGEWRIIVLQRGWVAIGKFERDGNECVLHNAHIIRQWGTKNGIGELANGKLPNTVLDKCYGKLEFDYLTVVFTLAVEADAWAKIL